MMDFLISSAYAQAATAQQPQGSLASLFIPMMLVLAVMYFMMIRPQAKRAKEHRQMISQIQKGDEVLIAGGIAGRVVEIGESFATLEIADEVTIKVLKGSINNVLPKGTLKSA